MARDMSNTSVLLDQIMHNLHNRVGALGERYIVDLHDDGATYTARRDETEDAHFIRRIDFTFTAPGLFSREGTERGYLTDVWFFGMGGTKLEPASYLKKLDKYALKHHLSTDLFGDPDDDQRL